MTKGERTKQTIIDQSLRLFEQRTVENVSIQEIAEASALKQPSFYVHFNNKSDLIRHCCEFAAEEGRLYIDDLVDERVGAQQRLKAYLSGNLKWAATNRAGAKMITWMYGTASQDAALYRVYERITLFGLQRIEAHILSGIREKIWSVKSSQHTARAIHNLLVGEVFKTVLDPSEISLPTRISKTWSTITVLLPSPSLLKPSNG